MSVRRRRKPLLPGEDRMEEKKNTREESRAFWRNREPFSADQREKEAFFEQEMKELTEYHRRSCRAYDDICYGLEAQPGPYLPVALFKDLTLRSVPEDQVVRQVTSSGTTGQQVSRIFLDGETADLQRWALCSITGDFIGDRRLPMLIIDSPDVLRDRRKFSARGAGILGFSMMSSRRFYALDAQMQLDWDSIEAFCQAAGEGPAFAFGFTFMIWQYFYQALVKEERRLNLHRCTLIHGGGWKKLQDQRVSDEAFRSRLTERCGFSRISDYYGMAEQTGSIFMQCEEGHLHASLFSDVEILDPEDFSPCGMGQWGLIALRSWIPTSYPGHMLLTEDWGRITGVDDCPCGRKGKTFEIQGRISKAEIRGCSDTFEGSGGTARETEGVAAAGRDAEGTSAAGRETEGVAAAGRETDGTAADRTWPGFGVSLEVSSEAAACFDPGVMAYLEELSGLFMRDPQYRQYPDIYALGFWLRPAHLQQIRKRQEKLWETPGGNGQPAGAGCDSLGETMVSGASGDGDLPGDAGGRRGRGLVLHIAPSNMPAMFAYSWVTGLLAGNANVVRLSSKESEISDRILEGIRQVMDRPAHEALKGRNRFLRFPRGHKALEEISRRAQARMIWGGDETVARISAVPAGKDCLDIGFPDKYSIAVLDLAAVGALSEDELRMQAHLFCRDTYGADQNACSSPKSVFWQLAGTGTGKMEEIKRRWWDAVASEAGRYPMEAWMATEKYRILCRTYGQTPSPQAAGDDGGGRLYGPARICDETPSLQAAGDDGRGRLYGPVRTWGNRLYVLPCGRAEDWPAAMALPQASLGIFFEFDLEDLKDMAPLMGPKIQTLVCIGRDPEQVEKEIRTWGCPGVDRVVAAGQALEFDTIWDRKDLVDLLSR